MLTRLLAAALVACAGAGLASCVGPSEKRDTYPTPTEVVLEESEHQLQDQRRQWIESLHRSAPDTDWKAIDRLTRDTKNRIKTDIRRSLFETGRLTPESAQQSTNTLTSPAVANLTGFWDERGSNNQSGRIVGADVWFNRIYLLSGGGVVWSGNHQGTSWQPLNDYVRFSNASNLAALGYPGPRLLVQTDQHVYLSDNDGATWNEATGLKPPADWGSIDRMVVTGRSTSPLVYVSTTEWNYSSWQAEHRLYKSVDMGTSFSPVSIATTTSTIRSHIWAPRNGTDNNVYYLNGLQLQILTPTQLVGVGSPIPTSIPASDIEQVVLAGDVKSSGWVLYAMVQRKSAYTSDIFRWSGSNWSLQGTVTTGAWTPNSLAVSVMNPDVLFAAGVDLYRSTNRGVSWSRISDWSQYYGSPATRLHADIHQVSSYFDGGTNTELFLVSTDGGTYRSTDALATVSNLTLTGMRTNQYYSVYSHRTTPGIIYAGSQDQGFQRTLLNQAGILDFDQLISGDYGQIVSGDGGQSIWSEYPGFVIYYPAASTSSQTSYRLDFPAQCPYPCRYWLPPTMADPANPGSVYVGGGGTSGGAHLWRYQFNGSSIQFTQDAYDFSLGFSTKISAMAVSPISPLHRYVVTERGDFFHSADGGATWILASSLASAGGHYLTGLAIAASPTEQGTVIVGGSGYSNPAAYISRNHGATFTAANAGLPDTLVYDLSFSADGSRVYAATEVGPYVYTVALGAWNDVAGVFGPDQTYWAVDGVEISDRVRFATYGRGLWDFGELLTNDAGSVPQTLTTQPTLGFLEGATPDGVTSSCPGSSQPDIWYRFVAPTSGILQIDTCGTHDLRSLDAGTDTVVSLYAGNGGAELDCNDDWPYSKGPMSCFASDSSALRDSFVQTPVQSGHEILVRVANYPGSRNREVLLHAQVAADTDSDGIADEVDNCTLVANPDQFDGDNDGYGNRCDGDLNNNGATNAQDTVIFRSKLGSADVVADLNHNGVVNAQDTVIFRALLGAPPGPSGLVP